MKKIVILANVAWTISNFRKHLIQDLISNGYSVHCIADVDDFSFDSIQKIESLGAQFTTLKINRKSLNPFVELLYIIRLYLIIKNLSPDVILTYTIKPNIFGSFVARLLNLPQISTINGLGSSLLNASLISKISFMLYRYALKHPYKVLFQNVDDLNHFVSKKILPQQKTVYVPGSGVNTEEFSICEQNNKKNEKIVFLLVARLIADKGIYEYIEAAKQIIQKSNNNCEFLLAGHLDNGNPTAIKYTEIEEWVSSGIIQYLGNTNNIKDFFIQADVIILPSYREGLSRLLLEAAACHKPLIVTNVPGCKELVEDNFNGYLCEPRDVDTLILAIEKMIHLSDTQRHKFGLNSRKIVSKSYTVEKVNAVYLNTLQSLFEGKKDIQ